MRNNRHKGQGIRFFLCIALSLLLTVLSAASGLCYAQADEEGGRRVNPASSEAALEIQAEERIDEEVDVPLAVLRSMGLDPEGSSSDGDAALEEVDAAVGTVTWRNNRYELTVPRDAERVALIVRPKQTSTAYAPTITLEGEGLPEGGQALPISAPSEPMAIGAGELQEYTIRSVAWDGLTVKEYGLVIYRTEASFTLSVSEAEWKDNGKRGFYIDCVADGVFSLDNFQLALQFDPDKLAVVNGTTFDPMGPGDDLYSAIWNLAEGFLDMNGDLSGVFEPLSTWQVDNTNGILILPFGKIASSLPSFVTAEGQPLFRIFFQIREESTAFDRKTLTLAVNRSNVTPQSGISCSQPTGSAGVPRFTSGSPDMASFSGLEKLFQQGDQTSGQGYVLDTAEPYGGDVLLTVSDPYKEDGSAYGKDESASVFIGGTGVAFSEELGIGASLEEGPGSEGETDGLPDGLSRQVMDDGMLPGSQVLRFEPTLGGGEPLRLSAREEGGGAAEGPPTVGEERRFQTLDLTGSVVRYKPVTFVFLGNSAHVNLWGEKGNESIGALSDEQLTRLREESETNYQYLTQRFGALDDKDGNGKLDILLYDIQDNYGVNGQTGYYQGVFNAGELFYPEGNDRDVLHLDTWPTMGSKTNPKLDAVLSTIVHEGQHLAFASDVKRRGITLTVANQQRYTPTWINEGLSMAAEQERYGVLSSRISQFNNSATIPTGQTALGRWGSRAAVDDYALTYLFFQYVRTQAEAAGISHWNTAFYTDYETEGTALEAILHQIPGFAGKSAQEVYRDFYLALYMQEPEGIYGFEGEQEFDRVRVKVLEKTQPMLRAGGAMYSRITSETGFVPAAGTSPRLLFTGVRDSDTEITLSVSAHDERGGTVTASPGLDSYEKGQAVTLLAAAHGGWRFAGWRGDVPDSQKASKTATIYMSRSKRVQADFTQIIPVRLSVSAEPTEGGTVSVSPDPNNQEQSGSYDAGTEVTVRAQPAEGWIFAGWREKAETGSGTGSAAEGPNADGTASAGASTEAVYTFTLEADRELIAVFEQLTYLPETALPHLLPQMGEEGTELKLTSSGALLLETGKGTLTLTAADGTPFTDLSGIPAGTVARAAAEASAGNRLLGIRVTKLGSARNASLDQSGSLGLSASLERGASQTSSIAVEAGSQEECLQILDRLGAGESVLLTGAHVYLPLMGYSVEAVLTSASSDNAYESLSLAKLTVETPAGRQLVRRTSGSGVEAEAPRFGFTGSVKEYDLYLLSTETEATFQPWIFDENFSVQYSYGNQKDVEVRQLPAEAGKEFQRISPVTLPVSQSGEGMDPVVFTITYTGPDGTTTSETCTIHLHRAAAESGDPVTKLELVRREGTDTAQVTVKLRKTTLGGARFTLDLLDGMELTDENGVPFAAGGEPSSYMTAGGIVLTGSGLERLEIAGVQYEAAPSGGMGGSEDGTGAESAESALRLSVTLAPKKGLTEGGAVFEEDTAVLTFFLSNAAGYSAAKQIAVVENDGEAGRNLNVIYDYNWGELWNRTKLVDRSTLLKLTGTFWAWHPALTAAWMPGVAILSGGEVTEAVVSERPAASGSYPFGLREYRFEASLPAGQTCEVEFTKAAHGALKITGVEVSADNLSGEAVSLNELLKKAYEGKAETSAVPELRLAAEGRIQLAAGDVTGDGRITLEDKNVLMSPLYYGKPVASIVGGAGESPDGLDPAALCDLNGDGAVTLADLNILMSPYNYGKGGRTIGIPASTGEGD